MDYFRNTTTGLGETVEYHGLLHEYHYRTWRDCGIPWITSGGLGETVEYHGLLQEYHYRTWRDC